MAEKYKVLTPNTGFTGIRAEVKFKRGVGMASKKTAQLLVRDFGYSCPDLENEGADAPVKVRNQPDLKPKEVEDFKKEILLDTAKEILKRDFVDRILKDDLVIEILEELQAQSIDNPGIEAAFMTHAESLVK